MSILKEILFTKTKPTKKLYHQIFFDSAATGSNVWKYDTTLQAPQLMGMVREDTINKQVFMVDHIFHSPNEDLLFDFGLNVSDTIYSPFSTSYGGMMFPIDSIKKLVLPNNDTSNILYYYNQGHYIENLSGNFMLEGVGAVGGIYNSHMITSASVNYDERILLCYRENGVTLLGDCIYPTTIEEPLNKFKFEVYPNPNNGSFTINLKEKSNSIVTIYNISGKAIFNKQFSSSDYFNINIDAPNGLYFVKVETENGTFTEKIIKQ